MKKRLWTILVILALTALAFAACAIVTPNASVDEAEVAPGAATAGAIAGADTNIATTDAAANVEFLPVEAAPSRLLLSPWRTNFNQRIVEWDSLLSGGPPKDGIAAIDEPTFESVDAAAQWLSERDPIILLEYDGVARGYPLAILTWHEIVNDTLNGLPVTVTFCPLCNASIVFKREFEGEILDFGVSGLLRNSDLVMYDRQSETWWQQFTGEGIVGRHAGDLLDVLPSRVISFGDFAAEFPASEVLARTSSPRAYGQNPYAGYDSSQRPFLFDGKLDERLPALERVVGLELGGTVTAYPFSDVEKAGAINDVVSDVPVVIFHKTGTASALDQRTISESRDVGSVAVYNRRIAGGDSDAKRTLTFAATGDGTFVDNETGSTWNLLGEAIEGELNGTQLATVLAFDHFWFAWQAFFPQTGVYGG